MTQSPAIFETIKEHLRDHNVVLYMKGTAQMPLCGFSATVVQILKKFEVSFQDFNVLQDEELRQGIKEFSDWPTIPQLYIKGEFIGGCDIVRDMFKTGEFKELLKEKGIPFNDPIS
ncbi:MAG: Grx4 family monothiol glutaredoxin [Alphaproteobacteria bacterium]|nr:Grx4 family monothiol glutaredoxin [Alphaproteobacteria bacterium]